MPILDQFGRPIEGAPRKAPTERARTASVRDRWWDYPSAALTPAKLAGILKSADQGDVSKQAQLFEEMEEKDTNLGAQMQTRKLAVQGLDYEVLPRGGAEDARTKRIIEFCNAALQGLDLDDLYLDLMDAVPKGYSMVEISWDQSEGQARIAGLDHIHPKDITFLAEGPLYYSPYPRLLTEAESTYGVEVPAWKCLYHRYKARSGWPNRAGLFRAVAWMYLFKAYAIKDWVGFLEVFAVPLRVGKYPAGASDADRTALLTALRDLGTDAAAIISEATNIEFIESDKRSSGDSFNQAISVFNDQETLAILGQVLTSGAQATGLGSGVASEHGQVRDDLIQADAKALSRTITSQLLRPLVGFNFGWDAPVPEFALHYEPADDLEQLSTVYDRVIRFGQPVSREHVSDRFGIPLPGEGETPITLPAAASPFQTAFAKDPGSAVEIAAEQPPLDGLKRGAAPTSLSVEQDLKALADRTLADAPPAIEAMIAPVKDLLDSCTTLDEFKSRLAEQNADLGTAQLGEVMARGIALAELAGKWEVSRGR